MSRVKTYYDKKFKSPKRELALEVKKKTKKKRKVEQEGVEFKYKSNRKQHEFNTELVEDIDSREDD